MVLVLVERVSISVAVVVRAVIAVRGFLPCRFWAGLSTVRASWHFGCLLHLCAFGVLAAEMLCARFLVVPRPLLGPGF
jgi:hypothetical protein